MCLLSNASALEGIKSLPMSVRYGTTGSVEMCLLGWKILEVEGFGLYTPFTYHPLPWDVAEVESLEPMHIFLTKPGALYGAMTLGVDCHSRRTQYIVTPVTFVPEDVIDAGSWDVPSGPMTATVRKMRYEPIDKEFVLGELASNFASASVLWLSPTHYLNDIRPTQVGEGPIERIADKTFVIKPL